MFLFPFLCTSFLFPSKYFSKKCTFWDWGFSCFVSFKQITVKLCYTDGRTDRQTSTMFWLFILETGNENRLVLSQELLSKKNQCIAFNFSYFNRNWFWNEKLCVSLFEGGLEFVIILRQLCFNRNLFKCSKEKY